MAKLKPSHPEAEAERGGSPPDTQSQRTEKPNNVLFVLHWSLSYLAELSKVALISTVTM